jgi:hypothetical protein
MNLQVLHKQVTNTARHPRFLYTVLLTGASLIAVCHLLPVNTQSAIANLLRNPFILTVLLVSVMIIGYYNFLAGILLLLMATCFILPMQRHSTTEKEGFENAVSIKNPSIMSLFDGPLSKQLKQQKAEADEFRDIKKAKETAMELDEIRKFKSGNNPHKKDSTKSGKSKAGKTTDTEGEDEEFTDSMPNRKTIEQRKFNPADNDDMNLLMTQEICDDIQNRIKYVYEDKNYLKKYIREKLEEIVDLLDLVSDDE